MPIYEYLCTGCKHTFRKLSGVIAAQTTALACPRCLSEVLERRISRFARVRSADDTLEAIGENLEALGDGSDTDAMRRLVRDMGSEMGEDLEQDFEAMLDEKANETPE